MTLYYEFIEISVQNKELKNYCSLVSSETISLSYWLHVWNNLMFYFACCQAFRDRLCHTLVHSMYLLYTIIYVNQSIPTGILIFGKSNILCLSVCVWACHWNRKALICRNFAFIVYQCTPRCGLSYVCCVHCAAEYTSMTW